MNSVLSGVQKLWNIPESIHD